MADEFKAAYIDTCESKNIKPRKELIDVLNVAAAHGYEGQVCCTIFASFQNSPVCMYDVHRCYPGSSESMLLKKFLSMETRKPCSPTG